MCARQMFSMAAPVGACSGSRVYRQARRQHGATLVEFALVAPFLMLMITAVIDLSTLLWVDLTMQHAVREGARYALTGRSDGYARAGDRARQVIEAVKLNSFGVFDRVKPVIQVTVNGSLATYRDTTAYRPDMFGNSGDLVLLQFDCSWPLMTPLMRPFFSAGTYTFKAATTFRNE